MDSTDEKVHFKQQMIKEAEMRDHAKLQQREIAKKRLEQGYKRDKMEAISSADYEPKEEPKESPSKFTEMLNKQDAGSASAGATQAGEARKTTAASKSSFQQMLADSEMKVGVAKKAPKKGMQLGKPKVKKPTVIKEDPVLEEEKQPEAGGEE